MTVPAEETAADGLREAVSGQSEAAGGVVETLDSWALSLGTMRVSVWPRISASIQGLAPAAMNRDAAVWRRSWGVSGSRPASWAAGLK